MKISKRNLNRLIESLLRGSEFEMSLEEKAILEINSFDFILTILLGIPSLEIEAYESWVVLKPVFSEIYSSSIKSPSNILLLS